MSPRFDTAHPDSREEGITAAAEAIGKGELVIVPTDTVYGIAADAFDAAAVGRLLQAKGRGRDMPPPVLVSSVTTMDALAVDIPDWVRDLTDEYWPGPLTVVLFQQTSLDWDLGETRGTVAVRMPDHHIALELLQRTGPLAVSSANTTGNPAALDADQALEMLGTEVTAVLDAGRTAGELASTILDCTGEYPRVLREGALPWSEIRDYLAEESDLVDTIPNPEGSPEEAADKAVEEAVVAERAASARKAVARKTAAKKAATKKAATKKAASKKTATKKAATKKTATKKTATKKTVTKKTVTRKAPAKKTATKKASTKKAPATRPPEQPPGDPAGA